MTTTPNNSKTSHFNLRDYQDKAEVDVLKQFSKGVKKLLVAMPTGGGKTAVFCDIAKKAIAKCNRALIFTNRSELLTQANGSLSRVGIDAFNIQAGVKYVPQSYSTFVAMSQTIRRRIDDKYWSRFLKSIDLFIIDECHLQDFNYLHESGIFENKFVLGFSATPMRSGKMRQLGLDYDYLINTVDVKYLIREGFLCQDDYYGCDMPDMSQVAYSSMKGDYQEKAMFNAFNQSKLYKGVVKNYKEICPNTKTLVFCCNIEHSIKTCQEFIEAGISAKYIVSGVAKPKYPKNPDDGKIAIYNEKRELYSLYCSTFRELSGDREDVFKGFERGDFQVLINAGIATAGYDCPSIETVIINRATMSRSLWLQMIGRGSRIFPGKTHFNILDFGGNQTRLGTYTESREWSLWHEESKGGGVAPVKRCGYDSKDRPIRKDLDGCGRFIHAGLQICPKCGFKYPKKELEEVELTTIVLDGGNNEFKRVKPVSKMNDEELVEYCKMKKHKQPWLWRQMYMRGGAARIDAQDWSIRTKETAKQYCQKHDVSHVFV